MRWEAWTKRRRRGEADVGAVEERGGHGVRRRGGRRGPRALFVVEEGRTWRTDEGGILIG